MWGNSSPSTTIKDDWRTKWFPYPFGRSERCKLLDQWATGKHHGNVKPPLLSDEWLKPNARLFFADYEAMMLAHCQAKWAKVITADDEKASGESAAGFQFGDSGPTDKITIHIKWNKQMMAALLYYSSQIVVPELRTRLLRAKANSDDMTWAQAKVIFTRYMESPNARFKLNAITCAKRADSEALLDWAQNILQHKEQCSEVEIKLPDSLWIDIAWGQMTPVERRIIGPKPDALSGLAVQASELEPRDLPI